MKRKKETDYTPCCALCDSSSKISDSKDYICSKKGIVNEDGICRKFLYDPLKRIPYKVPAVDFSNIDFDNLTEEEG